MFLINQESNHMLHYTILITHKCLKINMEDGKDFTRYADVCFREFGDRVKHWTTINEANMFVIAGYDWGQLPPQRCSQPFGDCSKGNSSTEPYIAAHHILLAHASAYRLYEKNYKSNEDEIATKRAIDFFIGWFLNPLVFGDYPDLMKKNAGSRIPAFTVQESKSVRSSFDFLGLNYYRGMHVNNVPNTLTWENRDAVADVRIQLESMPLSLEQLYMCQKSKEYMICNFYNMT
ncbi:Beta-glucosidase 22 [Morus notabilis]|uniref:Beta-glucosidase 22 n=1 Tax=Morus notabilis TaxID=981085 RepID=W9RPE3_9ROSA|nr:Beta-glucosidase 22 [Morus notabilis]